MPALDCVASRFRGRCDDFDVVGQPFEFGETVRGSEFVYQGEAAWEATGTNVPFVVSLKKGENVGDHLRQREKPDYGFFDRVELPRFLQKPTKGQGAGSSLTLGQSKVTTAGLGSR